MLISEAWAWYVRDEIIAKNRAEKTVKNYRSTLNSLLDSCSDIPIELLTPEHVVNWQINREREGHQVSYIANDLSKLRQVLKFLKKKRLNVLDWEHVERPTVKRRSRPWLYAEEVQKLIDIIPNKRDKAIFACIFDSGARISELINIDREHLHGDSAEIIGKGSKPGKLYFGEWSLGYLHDYLSSRKDNLRPLFVSGQYRRISIGRVEQLLHIYTDMAGITKNITPHDLRHSFASDLKLNGADIYDIKEQLRHERISSTEIYVHVDEDNKRKVRNKFHTNLARA